MSRHKVILFFEKLRIVKQSVPDLGVGKGGHRGYLCRVLRGGVPAEKGGKYRVWVYPLSVLGVNVHNG